MTSNQDGNSNLTGNKKKIDDIYNSWEFVGLDESGHNTYMPLSRKAIKYSKSVLSELKQLQTDEEEDGHIAYIKKVLRSAMKRKTRASWKVIIIVLILAGLWGWQLGAFTKPGENIIDKEGEELAEFINTRMFVIKRDIDATINSHIPETKAKIKEQEANIKAGISDKKMLKEAKQQLRKDKRYLKSKDDFLVEKTALYERRKNMTPEEYKADYIAVSEKDQVDAWITMGIWLTMIILYILSSRRPYFLFWKNSYEDGTLATVDDMGAAVVSSSLISSMVNFDSNSTEYVKWSDGSVTREANLTGGGIGIIFAVVVVMFYAMFIVITLPLRIVWNWLRNYVFYF